MPAIINQRRGCPIQAPPPPRPLIAAPVVACRNPRCSEAVDAGSRSAFCAPECKKRHDNLRWYYKARENAGPAGVGDRKPCATCGSEFEPQGRQMYCAPHCQNEARNKKRREKRALANE